MPPRAPAASSTKRRRHSGMRIAPRAGRSRPSSRSMLSCGSTCRSGWPAWSSRQAVLWLAGLWCRGRGADTGGGSLSGGPGRGALSRLPGASRATSPTMIPCHQPRGHRASEPRYLLEFDFRRHDKIERTFRLLDRARVVPSLEP